MELIQELVKRAQTGDRGALEQLKPALDAEPAVWQRSGDLAKVAETAWLDLFAGKDVLLAECVERKMADMRTELAGPHPSKLEALLVERIVACWLQVHYADSMLAERLKGDISPAHHRELLRRQESSQRRYHAALKDLTTVRKLLKPPVSPFELATRPIPEGKPSREAGDAATVPFRRAASSVAGTPAGNQG